MTAVEYITMLGEYYYLSTEQTAKMLQAKDEIEKDLIGYYPEDVRRAIEDYARTVDKRFFPKLKMLLVYLTTPENNVGRDVPIDWYFEDLVQAFVDWWNRPNFYHHVYVDTLTAKQRTKLRALVQTIHDDMASNGIKNLRPNTIIERLKIMLPVLTATTMDELLAENTKDKG